MKRDWDFNIQGSIRSPDFVPFAFVHLDARMDKAAEFLDLEVFWISLNFGGKMVNLINRIKFQVPSLISGDGYRIFQIEMMLYF